MRVLLVEDDLTVSRGVSLLLKSGGAVVDLADSGEEALELVRHYDYDIVLLDLMLPDMEDTRWSAVCEPPGSTFRS